MESLWLYANKYFKQFIPNDFKLQFSNYIYNGILRYVQFMTKACLKSDKYLFFAYGHTFFCGRTHLSAYRKNMLVYIFQPILKIKYNKGVQIVIIPFILIKIK